MCGETVDKATSSTEQRFNVLQLQRIKSQLQVSPETFIFFHIAENISILSLHSFIQFI
jgi:hypothetical protein